MKLSIAIPTYEMSGQGAQCLSENLMSLEHQTFRDFEVVIADHSIDSAIENLCANWDGKTIVRYYRNGEKLDSCSNNVNLAASKCQGEYIKILFQDDFLYGTDSLSSLVKCIEINSNPAWIACSCIHTRDGINLSSPHTPSWGDLFLSGANSIGSPSVICIRRDCLLEFNEDLSWLMDCEFYHRMGQAYGTPVFHNEISVAIRIWSGQLTSLIPKDKKDEELAYLQKMYQLGRG